MKHLRRLLPYVLRYRSGYIRGLTCTFFATLAGAAAPLLIKKAVDLLKKAEAGGDHGSVGAQILTFAVALILIAALRSLLVFLGRYIVLSGARSIEYDLRNDLYASLLRLPPSWYDAHPTGDITSRCINDLEGVRLMIGIGLVMIVGTGLTVVVSLGAMFWLDWPLALACLLPLSAITGIMIWTGNAMYDRSKTVQDQLGVISTRAQENFSGTRVIKAFAQEEEEIRRFGRECETYVRANMSLARLRGGTFALLGFFMELAIVVTVYVCGRRIMEGRLTAGDLTAFTGYQFMLLWPMIAVGWVVTIFQRGAACAARLAEILDAAPAPAGTRTPELRGAIEIRDLSFSYAADRAPALSHVGFRIEAGETVGIVGRTGAGKSTLASLLLKLHPAPAGAILVDGVDINDVSTAALRRATGIVTQEPFLFSDTVEHNVAFGSLDGATDEQVRWAAGLARIADDVDRFPGKFGQMIGERGITLSGGQKQRTAIARALIRRPTILILDDALSSVDAKTERQILDELRAFMKGRTSIVITHRMSAVRHADRIIVLDEGCVTETGTHEQLMARRGIYARMVEQQHALEEAAAKSGRTAP